MFHRTENVREEAFVMHRIYWGAPLVQETCFCVPNGQKDAVGTGNALLVYQMDKKMPLVQEKHFWCTNKDKTSVSGQWKETVAEQ